MMIVRYVCKLRRILLELLVSFVSGLLKEYGFGIGSNTHKYCSMPFETWLVLIFSFAMTPLFFVVEEYEYLKLILCRF